MSTAFAILVLLPLLAQAAPQAAQPIACEFRVFDGGDEVTRETRVRVYADAQKKDGVAADASGRVKLGPGLYQVQIIRERDGQVTSIRWIEHLLIQRYPDEEGRHLEIVNFKMGYGALELRGADADRYIVDAFAAGDRTRSIASGKPGEGYQVIVVPAGRYEVRLKPVAGNTPAAWLTDIDIPADRTRLRALPPAGQD